MSTTPVSATVTKAHVPHMLKGAVARTTYVCISVNIETGHISVITDHDMHVIEEHFNARGDPPAWRGLQIIRVDSK